jgi:hypothetical protein
MIPTTSVETPFISSRCPTTSGSPPKRLFQSASESTTVRSPPGGSASGLKTRPAWGVTPKTWKKPGVTTAPVTMDGNGSSRRARLETS